MWDWIVMRAAAHAMFTDCSIGAFSSHDQAIAARNASPAPVMLPISGILSRGAIIARVLSVL